MTKIITMTNQRKGKYLLEPMTAQTKTKQITQSAGKRG